jgi:hypothetical protein
MANKKISELQTRTPSLSDLILVGDPSNGFSYKCTVSALATIIETDISDGYVTLGTTQTISGAKTFSNNLTLTSVANASTDTDKFIVLNASNVVNFRTGAEVLSDIGGQGTITLTTTGTSGAATFVANTLNIPQYQGVITLTTTGTSGAATLVGNTLNIPNYAPDLSGYVPTSRTITINGTTQDLTANRTYNVGTVTSVAASGGTGISISGSPITSSGTITITNTAPDQVVALTAGTGISISGTYPNFTITNSSPSLGGTVTSVALSAPTGFAVTGSPITSSGTLALAFDTGYSLPTTASQTNWDSAYNNMIVSAAVTGTTTKTLTLTQQDAGTITASWTDDNTDAVTSVFGRTGAVVATEGDYSLTQLSDVTITSPSTGQVLKYNGTIWVNDTDANTGTVTSVALSAPTGFSVSGSPITSSGTLALSFASGYSLPTTASQTNWDTAYTNRITSLTTTGSSGSATLISNTLNIPTYTLAGLGGISLTSLSAFVPLSYNNTTGQFSIDKATTTADGYLSATDWNTFNNKQATITLTTTGTSGAATFTSNTLNIPQYQGALTLTTTGTSGAATLVGNTLNIPQYSGGGGTVSGTTNYIAKFTSSTAVGDSLLFDDGTNVGISTATAGSKLQVNGNAAIGYSTSTAAPTNGLAVSGLVGIGTNSVTISQIGQGMQIGDNTSNAGIRFNVISTGIGYIEYYQGTTAKYLTGYRDSNNSYNIRTGTSFTAGNGITLLSTGQTDIGNSTSFLKIIPAWNAGTGTWLDISTDGASAIGSGGAGVNPWVAYAASATQWFTASTTGDICYRNTAGKLLFGNSTTFAMAITGGNVGIATTTIGSKFQVNGNAAIGYSASTAAPTNGLQVAGNSILAGTVFSGNAETSATPAIGIISGTGGTGTNIAGAELRIRGGASTGSAAGGPITFYTSAAGSAGTGVNAGVERMRLSTSLQVGSSTTSVPTTIFINSSATAPNVFNPTLALINKNATSGALNGIAFNNSGEFLSAAIYTTQTQTTNSGDNLVLNTKNSGGGWNTGVILNTSGSLGIGTTTIGSTLQVNGNAAIGYSASTAAPTNGLAVAGNIALNSTISGWISPFNVIEGNTYAGYVGFQTNAADMKVGINNFYDGTGTSGYKYKTTNGAVQLGLSAANGFQVNVVTSGTANTNFVWTQAMLINLSGEVKLTPAANTSVLSTTGAYSLTGANAQSLIDLAGTWNTTGNPAAIKLNITNTASGASAYLMDLQVGGTTQFRVTKAGAIRTAAPASGTANDWKLGTRIAATVALDTTQYIEVEVGGTLYKLGIVT